MRNLQILFVIETGGAGSGRHVIDLASALARDGHRIGIIYSTLRSEPWFESEIGKLDNVDTYCLPMHREPHRSDFRMVREIRNIIREEGPFDIVHGHSSKAGALCRLAAIGTGCKTVYTPHAFVTMNYCLPRLKRLFYQLIELTLAPLADAIICVSSAEFDHAKSQGIASKRLRVVPNGLRPLAHADRISVREELGLKPEHIVVGFVGRLDPQKAVNILISAFSIIAKEVSEARLLIVGQGQDEGALRQLAESEGAAERIIWAGPANGARMMVAFDIFAMSSIYEAFPYVLIEAAFRALPIISTDVGGTKELVLDNYNGRVVSRGDVSGLADALLELVTEGSVRASMSAASLALAESFTVEKMVANTLDVYYELVAAK